MWYFDEASSLDRVICKMPFPLWSYIWPESLIAQRSGSGLHSRRCSNGGFPRLWPMASWNDGLARISTATTFHAKPNQNHDGARRGGWLGQKRGRFGVEAYNLFLLLHTVGLRRHFRSYACPMFSRFPLWPSWFAREKDCVAFSDLFFLLTCVFWQRAISYPGL